MLTVIRELAEEAEAIADDDAAPAELCARSSGEARTVARTPEMLAVLREAGVVDAGGAGLLEIVRGVTAAVTGDPLPRRSRTNLGLDAIHQELSRFRYCTAFFVEGDALDAESLERELEQLGDSLLVVGDPTTALKHLHTDDPGAALTAATARGAIAKVEIANMHEQTLERESRLVEAHEGEPKACEAIVVASGAETDGSSRASVPDA